MPSRFSGDPHSATFDHTITQLTPRLQRLRSPHQLMATVRWGLEELDRALAEAPAALRDAVACRAGCTACCQVPVDAQAHEVLYAADHILSTFSPEALTDVIARLAAHRDRITALSADARDASRQACALLVEGRCSIYAGRPQPCRAHHTSDAAVCDAHLADPSIDITQVYIPELRARLVAVMFGVDEAVAAAGYDERSYDFGSALHEALTNSFCLPAWLRQQSAFPDDCLSDRMPS